MNVNLYVIEDYENETAFRPKKTNPNKPNFKPDDGFSAHYTRDCHVAEFTLSAAEGGLAMTFLGAFLQVAARPEKNVDTMNVLVIKSYKIYPPPADLLKLFTIVVELIVFGAVLYNLWIGG